MEASRSHLDQLPFEVQPSVRAIDDRIVIESMTVTDERAAKVVRERSEAGVPATETVAKAIEIGARVIDSESTATNVDYVQRVVEEKLGAIGEQLGSTLDEGSEAIASHIAEKFDGKSSESVQGEIKDILIAATRVQQQEMTKLLTSEDAGNPLIAVQAREQKARRDAEQRHDQKLAELKQASDNTARALIESSQQQALRSQREISGLKEQIAVLLERQTGQEAVAEAEEAGTRKGRSFEDRVHSALEEIADGFGDVAQHTGHERGAGGTKKGDTVVEIGASAGPCRARIVFEDKVRRLSKNDAWAELNAAMTERQADYGVLVVAGDDNIPRGREQLQEYEGNKLIIAVDPDEPDGLALRLAYRYVRVRLLSAKDSSLEVDAGSVRDAAESAASALKKAQAIKLALTNIDKSSATAREGLEELIGSVETELARIEGLVAEAAEAEESS